MQLEKNKSGGAVGKRWPILKLWFNGEVPSLLKAEFSMPEIAEPYRCENRGSPRPCFQWTNSVKALCFYMVEYAAHVASGKPGESFRFEGEVGSAAASLDRGLGKDNSSIWMMDLFGIDEELAPGKRVDHTCLYSLIRRENPDKKRKNAPFLLRPDFSRHPKFQVEVFLGQKKLSTDTALENLLKKLWAQWPDEPNIKPQPSTLPTPVEPDPIERGATGSGSNDSQKENTDSIQPPVCPEPPKTKPNEGTISEPPNVATPNTTPQSLGAETLPPIPKPETSTAQRGAIIVPSRSESLPNPYWPELKPAGLHKKSESPLQFLAGIKGAASMFMERAKNASQKSKLMIALIILSVVILGVYLFLRNPQLDTNSPGPDITTPMGLWTKMVQPLNSDAKDFTGIRTFQTDIGSQVWGWMIKENWFRGKGVGQITEHKTHGQRQELVLTYKNQGGDERISAIFLDENGILKFHDIFLIDMNGHHLDMYLSQIIRNPGLAQKVFQEKYPEPDGTGLYKIINHL